MAIMEDVKGRNAIEENVSLNDWSCSSNRKFYLTFVTLLVLWVIFCWQGLSTAIDIWYGNEIFNHGFFIVPGALYLIYLRKDVIRNAPFYNSSLSFLFIIPSVCLYVIGLAGDIQLFLHAATFVLLPSIIWFMVGNTVARILIFPLCFMLFSIPVGEQLIPYLQEIAADGSVALLQLTGVPLFRSGLYIEIPQGRFLVAEACSGVSFFIASFVIGSLYAYLNLITTSKRIFFVLISLVFPIVANVIRVYGIILIAYWTDMEYAAGADHLIYGWFFFAFVIICLLGIGELLRTNVVLKSESNGQFSNESRIEFSAAKSSFLVVVIILSNFWGGMINDVQATFSQNIVLPPSNIPDSSICDVTDEWMPVLHKPNKLIMQGVTIGEACSSTLVYALFNGQDSELVSALNRRFDPNGWSKVGDIRIKATTGKDTTYIKGIHITSPVGKEKFVASWYVINEKIFYSDVEAKIYQTFQTLLGKPTGGTWVVVASATEPNLATLIEYTL